MIDILPALNEQITQMQWLEITATILAISYVLLAAKGNLWCWPAAFISSAISGYIFFDVNLKLEALLQIYYIGMAVYGYQQWKKANDATHQLPIDTYPWQWHAKWILSISLVSIGTGYIAKHYLHSDFAYIDAATTWFSIFATVLVTRRVLENWWYWIVIDAVCIGLYWEKSLYFFSLLFVLYVILAAYGLKQWQLLQQKDNCSPSYS